MKLADKVVREIMVKLTTDHLHSKMRFWQMLRLSLWTNPARARRNRCQLFQIQAMLPQPLQKQIQKSFEKCLNCQKSNMI